MASIEAAMKTRVLGSQRLQDRFLVDFTSIKTAYTPKHVIAVLGATGAGKSSMINAMLGFGDDVIPTSGIAACTSVVTEISYSERGLFEAEIKFIGRHEFKREISDLLEDLHDEGDSETNEGVSTSIAFAKVQAVCPGISRETLSAMDVATVIQKSPAMGMLGTTSHIEAESLEDFAPLLAQYVGAHEHADHNSLGLWALIQQIRIKCPSACLASGTVLVDLPGVGDINAARHNLSSDYIRKADHFWITAPITRAVSDQVAYNMFGKVFSTQLSLDRSLNPRSCTFIATKCDDVSSDEIIRELGLQRDPEYQALRTEMQHFKDEQRKWRGLQRSAETARGDMENTLSAARKKLALLENSRGGDGTIRLLKRTLPDQSESNASVVHLSHKRPRLTFLPANGMPQSLEDTNTCPGNQNPDVQGSQAGVVDCMAKIKDHEETIRKLNTDVQEAAARAREAECDWKSTRKRINAFCALKRSQYSKRRIQADFRTGLQQNHGIMITADIPVFTVSAREHRALEGDDDSTCFERIEETGIPALREWCEQLILPRREEATHKLLVHLRAFGQSLKSFVEGTPGVSDSDRQNMKLRWDSTMGGSFPMADFANRPVRELEARRRDAGVSWHLVKKFQRVVTTCVCDLQDVFEEYLGDKCDEGIVKATQTAVTITDNFGNSMPWQTYRATLRRDGCWRRDLNGELIQPFAQHIAGSWRQLFERDFFSSFETDAVETVLALVSDVVQSVPPYLRVRAEEQGRACMAEARSVLEKMIEVVDHALQEHQKTITRRLAPHVQEHLVDGYKLAMKERGPGSVRRQKDVMHEFVDENKEDAFNDAAAVVTTGLSEAATSIETKLNDALAELSLTVEKNIAVLWEGPSNDPQQVAIRRQVVAMLEETGEEIDSWLDAWRMRSDNT
ncbi:hypothetical protein C8Q76DRAFT_783295 [Earliella scabrosa]|nr:hypothetical protein C8Q76DRAFT_783295 [Earliella scabrosa]